MESIRLIDWITVAAIALGPLAAVYMTRWLDDRRFTSGRRMQIFKDLMRTRRNRISPDHVGALNLVEIEFHGVSKVISAWQTHMDHLGAKVPKDAGPEVWDDWNKTQDRNLTRLLHAIASELGFKIDSMAIFEGGYSPIGWSNMEEQQSALRLLLIDLLKGNRAMPITSLVNPSPNAPFPPPPPDQETALPRPEGK